MEVITEKCKSIESNYYGEMEASKVKHAEELQNLKENLATEINSLQTEYQELKFTHDKEFTALKHKSEGICTVNNSLNERVRQLSTQINELKETLQNVTTQKNVFETENKNYMFLQSKLQNENIKLCDEVWQVNEKHDDLNKKFEMCMQSLKQNEPEKLKLEEKVRYLTEKNIEFAKQIELLNDEKTKIEVKLNTHSNTIQSDLIRCQAEKKDLQKRISIEEAEKHNLKAESVKLKARPITLKENNCTMCANKSSSSAHTNKLCQTDKVYVTHSNHIEEVSDLKEKCDTMQGEISKLKLNIEDLKKVCKVRSTRIHELEGKCKNEKENKKLFDVAKRDREEAALATLPPHINASSVEPQ